MNSELSLVIFSHVSYTKPFETLLDVWILRVLPCFHLSLSWNPHYRAFLTDCASNTYLITFYPVTLDNPFVRHIPKKFFLNKYTVCHYLPVKIYVKLFIYRFKNITYKYYLNSYQSVKTFWGRGPDPTKIPSPWLPACPVLFMSFWFHLWPKFHTPLDNATLHVRMFCQIAKILISLVWIISVLRFHTCV